MFTYFQNNINFSRYLSSRSVISVEPEDSSFSSHSDDFGSTNDLEQLTETDMSDSLLYCMNGNRPTELSSPEMNTIQNNTFLQQQSKGSSKKRGSDYETNNSKIFGSCAVNNIAENPNKFMKFCNEDNNDLNDYNENGEPAGQTSL